MSCLENEVLEERALEQLQEELRDKMDEDEIEKVFDFLLENYWESTLMDSVETYYWVQSVKGELQHQKQFSDVINLIFTGEKA